MSLQRLRKKGTMVSGMFVLVIHALGFVAESYSAQNLRTVRTDGEIQGAVLKRLGMDSRIDSNDLGANVEDGHVKIFGMVDSLKEKHVASHIVGSIDGVKSLLNSLRIKPDLDEDRQIRLGIEQLIEIAGLNETDSVMVNAENGVVTIKGLVSTRNDKNAIQKISENRPGVTEVKNLLTVRASAREDMVIQKDVLFYLLWSPFFKKDEINVEVVNGTVKLDGHTDFLAEKTMLIENIEHIQGVERIDAKNLTIKPETPFTQSS